MSEWIKVEERLPPMKQDVLFCGLMDGQRRIALGQMSHEKDTFWTNRFWVYHLIIPSRDVTHWMPLPEPPQ
jgi:hypothetical protein